MKLSDFDYPLGEALIAHYPSVKRDSSRLMAMHRKSGEIFHHVFSDLPALLPSGSLLVLNDSRVFPARLRGVRESGSPSEILLLKALSPFRWQVLLRGRFRAKQSVSLEGGLRAQLIESADNGTVIVEFPIDQQSVREHFLAYGEVPLPPYIVRDAGKSLPSDREAYQTVYAREYGSVAAPTAGLHFTRDLLLRLNDTGIETAFVTLHVGAGDFRPVNCDTVGAHRMDEEFFEIPAETALKVSRARREGKTIIAVGTTATRALETASDEEGVVCEGKGTTRCFIYPGYRFKTIGGLVHNFHLPKSTLLLLVSAFAGRGAILNAYQEAMERKYRFFSYGDAMLIL